MKLHHIFLYGALGISFLSAGVSCSDDDFLTEDPRATMTIDNAYDKSSQVLATIFSAYYEYDKNFYFTFGTGIAQYKMVGTDICDMPYNQSHYSNFGAYWPTDADFIKEKWDSYYKMISYCNLALSKMDAVTWSNDEEKTRAIAEARFLRGFSYLKLAEYYGGVPIVEEYSEHTRFDYERASRSDVYAYAIGELEAAYNDLPTDDEIKSEYGRAGKGAAAMALSEAYLAQGVENGSSDFTKAENYAREVVNAHPLMQNRFGVRTTNATGNKGGVPNAFEQGNVIYDLYVSDNVVAPENTEAVWVVNVASDYATWAQTGGLRDQTIMTSPALQDISWSDEYMEDAPASNGPWRAVSAKYGGRTSPAIHGGFGWAFVGPTWYMENTIWNAENNYNTDVDYRYVEGVTVRTKYLCCDENHSLYEQPIGWKHISKNEIDPASKFFGIFYKITPMDDWDYDSNDPGDMGMPKVNLYRNRYCMRSAEAYLLLAEAQLRNGKAGEALNTVNQLRARANAKPMPSIDLQKILDERARELVYEEDRWGTFLRMEPEVWKPRIKNYGTYTAGSNDAQYPEIRRWSEYTDDIHFNLWPIPKAYIDLNSEVQWEQNAGW